ncbi:MAG: S41 family peptidase [Bacteroidales bacterium]
MTENRKNSWVIFALIFTLGLFLGTKIPSLSSFSKSSKEGHRKIEEIFRIIHSSYVDTVNDGQLTTVAIEAMLRSLDPHSVYIPAQDFEAVSEDLKGNFEGIGVQFRMIKDTVVIIMPVSGGPAEKVGVRSGDRIIMVDKDTIAGKKMSTDEIMKKLKGVKGTKVKLGLQRSGDKKLTWVEITRDVIPSYSIDAHFMVKDGLGYVKISKFSATTTEEFSQSMQHLQKQGLKKLIIDLRSNGGGLLGPCIEIADMFLKKDAVIVYTHGNHRKKTEIKASGKGAYQNIKLVILIDEWSASASEILSGAIQDNDRGKIVGRRSFGKGLVQEQMEFKDGSALRLTVARYYTPSGRCIQKPYKGKYEDYEEDLLQRYVSGEMTGTDSSLHADTAKYYTLNGRIVYGGGGIQPDVSVPYRTDPLFVYLNQIGNQGLSYQFAFDYCDSHRAKLKKQYPTASKFIKEFNISNALFEEFLQYVQLHGVRRNNASIDKYGEKMKTLLKAYIARDLYDDPGFYPIYLRTDEDFIHAVNAL